MEHKRLCRSWMFVPGDRQRMIEKALALPVDAIMMDIEDGVTPNEKDIARRQIATSLDFVIAEVETVAQVRIVEDELGRAEVAQHMPGGSVKLLIAIESPIGLFNAYQIATCSPRIIGLMFGAEDFTREMNLPARRTGEAVDLIYARSHLATAAAAAHIQAVDGVW